MEAHACLGLVDILP